MMVSSEPMNFSDLLNGQNKLLIGAQMTTDEERGRLIFNFNFTELGGSVVYRCKNLSLHLQHLLRLFVFIYTDFQLNVLHRTLCF